MRFIIPSPNDNSNTISIIKIIFLKTNTSLGGFSSVYLNIYKGLRVFSKIVQLKFKSSDGKRYATDAVNIKQLLATLDLSYNPNSWL